MPLRSGGTAAKATMGGVVTALLVCGWIGLRACSAYKAIAGETVSDQMVTIDKSDFYGGTLEVSGNYTYTFRVTALDGPVSMAVSSMKSKDKPSAAEIIKMMSGAQEVPKGQTRTLTGSFHNGHYMWIVDNESEEKSVRVRIDFNAK
jgi:hypothetical protein